MDWLISAARSGDSSLMPGVKDGRELIAFVRDEERRATIRRKSPPAADKAKPPEFTLEGAMRMERELRKTMMCSCDLWERIHESPFRNNYGTLILDLLRNEATKNTVSLLEELKARRDAGEDVASIFKALFDDDAVGKWFYDPLSPAIVRVLFKLPAVGEDPPLWVFGELNQPGVMVEDGLQPLKYPAWTVGEFDSSDLNEAMIYLSTSVEEIVPPALSTTLHSRERKDDS